MSNLRLTRTRGDRRLYELGSVGRLRVDGWGSRSASAEAGASRWQIAGSGLFRREFEARDIAGGVVGRFSGGTLSRGGTLEWAGTQMTLQHRGVFHHSYDLADGPHHLATFDGSGWGRHPVHVHVAPGVQLARGLLLFAAFVVKHLARDNRSATAPTPEILRRP